MYPGLFTITSDCVLWVAGRTGLLRYGCNGEPIGSAPARREAYRDIAHLSALPGDTVALFDPRLQRIVIYSKAGEPLRTIPLPVSEQLIGDVRGLGRVPDGFVLWTVEKPRGQATSTERRSYAWRFYETSGRLDTLLTVPAPEWAMARDRINTVAVEAPFGRHPVMLFREGRLLVGDVRSDVLDVYDGVETEPRRVTLELGRRTVRSMDAEDYAGRIRERLFGELGGRHFGPEMREYFANKFAELLMRIQYPDSTGYFALLVWGSEGDLWAQIPCVAEREPCMWAILDERTGSKVGSAIVSHQGHVTYAKVLGEALFTIELGRGGTSRIAKYIPSLEEHTDS